MRATGKINDWNDNKGYGFIVPDGGGSKVFVHIKAFNNRSRRPTVGDTVAYSIGKDETGRTRATNATLAGNTFRFSRRGRSAASAFLFSGVFLAAVGASVTARQIPSWILIGYVAASTVTFVVYAFDKSAAQGGRWRTTESTLHLLALAGGWPGALVAQQTLRHKSKKMRFRIVFWATVMANCASLVWLHTSAGRAWLAQLLVAIGDANLLGR